MAELLSSYLNVDPKIFDVHDILNAVIDVDTKLFLDPYLLKSTKVPEFIGSRKLIIKHFSDIMHLLSAFRRTKKQRAWDEALKRLTFKETAGVFIGYGASRGDGNGIGPKLATKLLQTGLDILEMGIEDPEIFELMGLFEEDFGADRLSDMTISILHYQLCEFSARITREICAKKSKLREWKYNGKKYLLPCHPSKGNKPVLFLPRSLLRDLPVACSWEAVDHVVSVNRELRDRLNRLIGKSWKNKITKSEIREIVLSDKNNIQQLLTAYKNCDTKSYDFTSDPSSESSWYLHGAEVATHNTLNLPKEIKTIDDLENIIDLIVAQFQKLIEVNGLNKILYIKSGRKDKPRHERYAQHLFLLLLIHIVKQTI